MMFLKCFKVLLQLSEKPPKDMLEEEVRHVPLWLADPISDGNFPDLLSRIYAFINHCPKYNQQFTHFNNRAVIL